MDYQKIVKTLKKIALIPARAGSKGIPNKNIVDLGGIPLIEWSIKVARDSNFFDVVCVSTDSLKISAIAKLAGAEVPFIRPQVLSSDDSLQFDVIRHCLDFYDLRGVNFDTLTLLQPTSPFRKVEDIYLSHSLFGKSKAETLISVMDISNFDDSTCYTINNNQTFLDLLPIDDHSNKHKLGTLRQNFIKKFWRNGSIYIFKPNNILFGKNLIKGPITGYEMPWERSVNIDNKSDLEIARFLVSNGVF